MNIPNSLSIARLCLIPIFVFCFFFFPQSGIWALIVLILSAATDVLDGFIARKFHMTTQLGRMLDPLADKLTQLAVSVCLAIRHKEFIILLCLLVVKEIIMLTIGVKLYTDGYKIPSSKWFGKLATVVFYAIMMAAVYFTELSNGWLLGMMLVVVIFSLMAFILYIPEFFKLLNKDKHKEF